MNELKPCPFCGGKAAYDTNGSAYWVICLECGARSRTTCFYQCKGKRIVTEAWNRRVRSTDDNVGMGKGL